MFRFQDGKIAEVWEHLDTAHSFASLGLNRPGVVRVARGVAAGVAAGAGDSGSAGALSRPGVPRSGPGAVETPGSVSVAGVSAGGAAVPAGDEPAPRARLSAPGGTNWTEKGSLILYMASRLRAGVVWANTFNKFDPASPFGGYKESGYGREGGRQGLEAYLDV